MADTRKPITADEEMFDKDLALEAFEGDNLSKARCRLTVREPWYGSFAIMMDWKRDLMTYMEEGRRTMGVRIMDNGRVECVYNPDFVAKLSVEQAYAIVKHEIEHIVRLHPVRRGDRHPLAWNIVADMSVNGKRSNPICIYKENSRITIPGENCVWKPEDWEDNATTEHYYDMLPKEEEQQQCQTCGGTGKASGGGGDQDEDEGDDGEDENNEGGGEGEEDKEEQGKGQGDSDGDGQGDQDQNQGGGGGSDSQDQKDGNGKGKPCPDCGGSGCSGGGGYSQYGEMVDNHDFWDQSTMSQDEARQLVKDMVEQASAKAQGHTPGHLQQAIEELNDPIVRWREIVRQFLGRHVGNRRKTFARRNRRIDKFGVKGVSHHAAATLGVIVDTSGSIGNEELKQFFGEIEALSARAKIWILQWDHAFQGLDMKYRRGDWKKIKIKGRGGTDMIAPIKYTMEQGLPADAVVMLTDGYCQYPDTAPPFPMIICITTEQEGPSWASNVRIA
jgi:predicted metal-dependent peptidase